jgi:uncharacterized membrane protein
MFFKGNIKKLIAVLMIVGTILFVYGVYYNQKVLNAGLKEFYESNVEGRINTIEDARSLIIITLAGHGDKQYIFKQNMDGDLTTVFYPTVQVGDMIAKKANSDTITVVDKHGSIARYTLKKPE